MGCLHSKKETTDLHPNVFRVVNIDENGADLCSGRLEITETDIVLYREGRDTTIWPLHSLRRYGFEGDIFSFESGRRCETGEGIYAFRCRRASLLFRTLQQQIQLRNVINDSVPYPVSRLTPSPVGRQTVQASVVHRSSVDNGQPDNLRPVINNNLPSIIPHSSVLQTAQSPRSPSSADILEVMPLYPRPQTNSNHVTNVYQLREFKKEHNNNQRETATDTRHVYTNDINKDLAMLRNTLRQEAALNTMKEIEDETRFLESRYMNESIEKNQMDTPLSPTLSSSSEHYAQLSLEQQESVRLYMNIAPNDANVPHPNKSDPPPPSTPLTPKLVEYCNLTMGSVKTEINTYANLSLGEVGDSTRIMKRSEMLSFSTSEHNQKYSESDTFTSLSPIEEIEVNYAILDIDSNRDSAIPCKDLTSAEGQPFNIAKNGNVSLRGRLTSQGSSDRPPPAVALGYTTIDFDKTVALTSVAAGTDIDVDGKRRPRHGSCIISSSPSTADHRKAS